MSPEPRRRKTRHNISSKIDLSNDFQLKNAKICNFFAFLAPNARARVRRVCMCVRAGVLAFLDGCGGTLVSAELGWIARDTRSGVKPGSSRTGRTSKTSRTGYRQKVLPQRQAHRYCMPRGTKPLKHSAIRPRAIKQPQNCNTSHRHAHHRQERAGAGEATCKKPTS